LYRAAQTVSSAKPPADRSTSVPRSGINLATYSASELRRKRNFDQELAIVESLPAHVHSTYEAVVQHISGAKHSGK